MGAQNTTKEFPPQKLVDLGMQYVILGHSDVRKLGETDEEIKQKIQECLAVGLNVILCVGENKGENKEEVLKKQLAGVAKVMVAYEPVWAISNGDPYTTKELPSAQIVKESVALIKQILGDSNARVIYGGSTNASNAADYLQNGGVDGLLPGGASLKADEFIKMVKAAE